MHFSDRPRFGDTVLVQIGRRYCMPLMKIDKHVHLNLYEITVVTDGEGVVTTNECPSKVSKGDIYISFPADFHQIDSSAEKPLKYDYFAFHTVNPDLEAVLKQIAFDRHDGSKRVIRNEKIAADLSSAIAEYGQQQEYREELLALLFQQIILRLIRSCQSEESPGERRKSISSADEICFQIMNYIDINLYSIQNLTVLSEELGYHYSYLSRVFKETTGGTILEYYRSARLEVAKLLLAEGKLKCIQIAEILNYSSLYSFSKAFKQKYGVSPRRFIEISK